MNEILILTAVVIVICIVLNKISNRLGIPMLLGFIVLGMVFGSDGILKIQFDNFAFADYICSTALIFIMFYGGFGTNWSEAKPIAVKAVSLSTLGVVLTAGFVGLFCHYVFFGKYVNRLTSCFNRCCFRILYTSFKTIEFEV